MWWSKASWVIPKGPPEMDVIDDCFSTLTKEYDKDNYHYVGDPNIINHHHQDHNPI